MDIKSLENIDKLTNDGLYDLHIGDFSDGLNIKIKYIILNDSHTGRPWKLCNDLYQNTDNIDIICDMNGIYNPLSIKAGDIIFYTEKQDINVIRNSKQADAIANSINKIKNANKGKEQKTDSARAKDKQAEKQIEKNKVFNSTAAKESQNKQNSNSANIINNQGGNIKYEDGKITLFPNF